MVLFYNSFLVCCLFLYMIKLILKYHCTFTQITQVSTHGGCFDKCTRHHITHHQHYLMIRSVEAGFIFFNPLVSNLILFGCHQSCKHHWHGGTGLDCGPSGLSEPQKLIEILRSLEISIDVWSHLRWTQKVHDNDHR